MASKLVGQLDSIDIIADKINRTGLANAINPNPEIMADYHQMIKKGLVAKRYESSKPR